MRCACDEKDDRYGRPHFRPTSMCGEVICDMLHSLSRVTEIVFWTVLALFATFVVLALLTQ